MSRLTTRIEKLEAANPLHVPIKFLAAWMEPDENEEQAKARFYQVNTDRSPVNTHLTLVRWLRDGEELLSI